MEPCEILQDLEPAEVLQGMEPGEVLHGLQHQVWSFRAWRLVRFLPGFSTSWRFLPGISTR